MSRAAVLRRLCRMSRAAMGNAQSACQPMRTPTSPADTKCARTVMRQSWKPALHTSSLSVLFVEKFNSTPNSKQPQRVGWNTRVIRWGWMDCLAYCRTPQRSLNAHPECLANTSSSISSTVSTTTLRCQGSQTGSTPILLSKPSSVSWLGGSDCLTASSCATTTLS